MAINFIETGASESVRQESKTFIAGGVIAANTVVMYDLSQSDSDRVLYVVAGTAGGAGLVAGIALEAAAAGDRVRVAVKGYVEDAVTDTFVTSGMYLCCNASAQCTAYAGTEAYGPFALALEIDTAAAADVFIF